MPGYHNNHNSKVLIQYTLCSRHVYNYLSYINSSNPCTRHSLHFPPPFFFFFWLHCSACEILVPRTGIEAMLRDGTHGPGRGSVEY